MLTIGEAIQREQSLYSAGLQSKDSRLTSRHIYSALLTGRALLFKQMVTKNQKVSQWNYQSLPCIDLIKAPVNECPCAPQAGCTTLRSKYKIPRPIQGIDKILIQSITSMDGELSFDITSFGMDKWNKGNKYTANKAQAFFRSEYLYITVNKYLKGITLTALFNNPIEVNDFIQTLCPCEDCQCSDIMDLPFPIDQDLIKPLLQLANDELIIMMKQLKPDNIANAQDDTLNTGMVHQNTQG